MRFRFSFLIGESNPDIAFLYIKLHTLPSPPHTRRIHINHELKQPLQLGNSAFMNDFTCTANYANFIFPTNCITTV